MNEQAVDMRWVVSRQRKNLSEKTALARYFVDHHFLIDSEDSLLSQPRRTRRPKAPVRRAGVASILVNGGTTPNVVVGEILQEVKEQTRSVPFFLTWYTPGLLVPGTLRDFCSSNRHLRTATRACLFPGEVDDDMDSVSGPYAEQFANGLERRFNYAILSAYSFDLRTGQAFFHSTTELLLQRAIATRNAEHKFLFLDSSKLKGEGERGYDITDLLKSAQTVTIYTVTRSAEMTAHLKEAFRKLCDAVFRDESSPPHAGVRPDEPHNAHAPRTLRLQLVGAGAVESESEVRRDSLR